MRQLARASLFRFAALAWLLVFASTSFAAQDRPEQLTFGKRTLSVPRPTGFIPGSEVAPQLMPILQSYLPSTNRLVEAFVDAKNIKALVKGSASTLDPYFQLQVLRSLEGVVVSSADFAAQAKTTEAQIELQMKTVEADVAEAIATGNAEATKATGSDFAVGFSDSRYLGVFRREPWGTFFSMQARIETTIDGKAEHMLVGTSGVIALINHQVLLLYSNRQIRSDADLQWTRDSLSRWADRVRAANPDAPGLEVQAKLLPRGVDWTRLYPLAGAAVVFLVLSAMGALIAFVVVSNRRRPR